MIHNGRFGAFGGTYVPEILIPALEQLEQAFLASKEDPEFKNELEELLARYVGRPTPIYKCRNFGSETGATIYLKREDLAHGGAHKTNQVLAQGLLAKRMGKTRIIAETGAGQHGVACALIGALLQMETVVYMGAKDAARQQPNVFRMELMGAKVIPVSAGSSSLKDAINEALRDWAQSFHSSHYLLGTVAGPHPFPTLVRDFQKIIGEEAKRQILEAEGRLPDTVMACVGGGSNAIGMFHAFVPESKVELVGVEPGGHGVQTEFHGATLGAGKPGILHGCRTYILQDEAGQIHESHSVSAGLDYPGVGPEHAHLQDTGRAQYVNIEDHEALSAFSQLCKQEGIIPALESAHALAHALKVAQPGQLIMVNLSGRGDKDLATVRTHLEEQS